MAGFVLVGNPGSRRVELFGAALERMGQTEAQKVFQERSTLMQQAVQRLRDLQEQLRADDERLRTVGVDLAAKAAAQEEQAALLQARSDQVLELQRRLEADRAALRQREESLNETDGARGSLQEQLVRRSEELAERNRELEAKAQQLEEQTKLLGEQADAAVRRQVAADGELRIDAGGGAPLIETTTHARRMALLRCRFQERDEFRGNRCLIRGDALLGQSHHTPAKSATNGGGSNTDMICVIIASRDGNRVSS